MNILFFIDPQSYNNLGMYDYEILSRIKDWDIYFIGNKKYDYLSLPHVKIRKLFRYGKFSNPLLKAISYIFSLVKILLLVFRYRPKVIHIQWVRIPTIDFLFYKTIKSIFNISLVYTVHNILPHKSVASDKRKYGKLYNLCDILLVHTNKTKLDLSNQFLINIDKIKIVPHGPLEYKFSQQEVEQEVIKLRKEYNISKGIIFGSLGNQTQYKGTDLLLEAWKSSPKLSDNDKLILLIAGKISPEISIHNLSKNIIVINKRLSDLEFAALLSITNVLMLPYRKIEQSGILLSGISNHIPYCATNVGELTYPLSLADIGWIIEEPSTLKIQFTLHQVIKSPEDIYMKKNNVAAWNMVAKKYSWDENAAITRTCYSSIID